MKSGKSTRSIPANGVANPRLGSEKEPPWRPSGLTPMHRGDYVLPESGQRIWWTGRVAIGLTYGCSKPGA
jgi:hypothetical protein